MHDQNKNITKLSVTQGLIAVTIWRCAWQLNRTIGAAGYILVSVMINSSVANTSEAHKPVVIAPVVDKSIAETIFTHEIEHAFLDLGLTLTDPHAIVGSNANAETRRWKGADIDQLARYFANKNQHALLIEASLSKLESRRLLPVLRAVTIPNGRLIGSVAGLDLAHDANRDELRIAAISLARRAFRQVQDNSRDIDWAKGAKWASAEHKIHLKIENFNSCVQNYILEEMETQFPGFISIDLVNATQSNYAEYEYRTTAKHQRLAKWINIFFMEHHMIPEHDFTILYQRQSLRLISENGAKFGVICNES